MKNYIIGIIVGLVIIVAGIVIAFVPPIFDFVSNNILAVITIIIGLCIAVPFAILNG